MLHDSNEHIVVRTVNRAPLRADRAFGGAPLSAGGRAILAQFETTARFADAGVEVLRVRAARGVRALRDRARALLKEDKAVAYAGRVLVDPKSARPVIYTENFFVKFDGDARPSKCLALLKSHKLTVKRELPYLRNGYFLSAAEGTGREVFAIADRLLRDPLVELCHPELVRPRRARRAFDQQWHLKKTLVNGVTVNAHANVESAWALTQGDGITIAVIDDGVDIDHEEFRASGKVIAPRDATLRTADPRHKNADEGHGTSCAGVACGDGNFGASGVAPRARLMPIRLRSALGSVLEAEAFVWAADHGADVISCSWGPEDGTWYEPNDPKHQQVVPLPDSTRTAIDYAVRNGRSGKGCVVCFAAGNGNESVDNDGYASYANVIAVAAVGDRGVRSVYSDFGRAVWCAFPSSDFEWAQQGHRAPLTPGIWTTDRTGGAGENPGDPNLGDSAGHYTNSFGGTSSACPGAAGVAALVLARNPNLRTDEVRDVLRRCCDKVDASGGNYDASGRSPLYGYGRLNARTAVELALPSQPTPLAIRTAQQDVPVKDFTKSRLKLAVADTAVLKALKVTVNIDHTYIGDLIVTLRPPTAMGVAAIVLHNRAGDATDNLKKTYDELNAPGLSACRGKSPAGTWTLEVADKAAQDEGMIRSFTLELGF
ncbi:MAG TPA: S8 family serine peptidase [Verrucomicrobiae bacterium]